MFVQNHRYMPQKKYTFEQIFDIIRSPMENQIPQKEQTHRFCRSCRMQILQNAYLLVLIADKKRLRCQSLRNNYNLFAHVIKSQIGCLTKIIDDRIFIARRENWEISLNNVKLYNHTFHNINIFAGNNRWSQITPLVKPLTNVTKSHFEKVHSQNDHMIKPYFDGSSHLQIDFNPEF